MKIGELKGKIKNAQERMSAPWVIEPNAFEKIRELYSSFTKDPKSFLDDSDSVSEPEILTIDGNLAIIEIAGPLVEKHDCLTVFFGCCSYEAIENAIKTVSENEEIEKVIFNIDSPGGMVKGVDNCSQAINALCKPTEARVSGMAASAAYWLASQCDVITATSLTASFGSIGVVIEYWDGRRAMNDMGYDEVVIVSANAPNKRLDAMDDDDRKKIKQELTNIEEIFIRRVSQGRNVTKSYVKANFGQGGMLLAEKSKFLKMIDNVEIAQDNIGDSSDIMFSSEDKMNLQEFLAENETAKNEFDAAVNEAVKKALETATEETATEETVEQEAETKKVSPAAIDRATEILKANYSALVKDTATKVIKGDATLETLEAVVAVYDENEAAKASNAAQAETEEIGDTASQETNTVEKDINGVVSDEASYKASIERMKKLKG